MIPDYQTLMRPVLECSKRGEIAIKAAINQLADQFQLNQQEREELLPSARQAKFVNRVHWAKTYLKQAGLVRITKRGHFKITPDGKKALLASERIDKNFLAKYPAFQDFIHRGKVAEIEPDVESELNTPDEILRKAHQTLNATLASELLSAMRDCRPAFFEGLVLDLLLAMGYGGASDKAGRALGRSGDGGVDGVIDQDALGVDQIYIQAKKYQATNTVGSGEIRDFFGSLNIKKASKGIFVTTSDFTKSAVQTTESLGHRIVLINGEQLAKLMIRYNIGCRDEEIIYIKKIDEDYFGS